MRIDIHEEVWALCATLKVEPDYVTEILISPCEVRLKELLRDAEGRALRLEGERRFQVTT